MYSDDFVVGNGLVARVTEGERRFGRLLDLDLKRNLNSKLKCKMKINNKDLLSYKTCLDRLDDDVEWERERDDRDELIERRLDLLWKEGKIT